MNIAIVRGDFASPWELQNFEDLAKKHKVVLFTGLWPVSNLTDLKWLEIVKLASPADLNFGRINKYKMGILNRVFTDAHFLVGLEKKLQGFDIAHCAETYYGYNQQCITAKNFGYINKIVSTVWENIPNNNEKILGRKKFKSNSISQIDKFLCVSEKSQKVLISEGCKISKTIVLRPGVDLTSFKPINHIRRKIKLLFVGRLVAEKGIIELLNIFQEINNISKQFELNIVGTGPLLNKIQGKNIKYLGEVEYSQMPQVYASCDLFIHPAIGSETWVEQYGMVLVEAMACGLPIIASDIGTIKEIVGDAGVVTDISKFEENILRFKNFPKIFDEFSKKAAQRAKNNFDSVKYSIKLEQIYEKVLMDAK